MSGTVSLPTTQAPTPESATQELSRAFHAAFDAEFNAGEGNADPSLAWLHSLAGTFGVPKWYAEQELDHYYQERGYLR